MNPYLIFGSGLDSNEAQSLSARLTAWHDAMVAHERRLRTGRTDDVCDDECPHAEARALWSDAIAVFGPRVHELTFLRSRATGPAPHSGTAAAAPAPAAEAGVAEHGSRRTRGNPQPRALAAASGALRAVELQS